MHPRIKAGWLALTLAAASLAAAQDLPGWLVDARGREVRLGEAVAVSSQDAWFHTRVPGRVREPVVLEGKSYGLSVELPGGVVVSCEVLRGGRDLASLMKQTAEISFQEIAKLNGAVEVRALEAIDAGVVGTHPFLSLRWMYRANRDGERRVGGLK